jgi:D-methionine transport system ATP-binding protein
MDTPLDIVDRGSGAQAAGEPMIRMIGVHKTFAGADGPVEVLRGVSLAIEKGDIFGIIGRSGAGKSTLVRCINMLERPTAGWIIVDGEDVTHLSPARLRYARRRIGMIFQHFNLLSSRTAFDNVGLPLEIIGAISRAEIRKKVEPLLDLVGLTEKRDHYPAQLSGGQKQRVGIARALASDPSVLLCDEATSALDPETTKSILELLADINERLKLTIVLVTHEMQVIKQLARHVAVLDQGVVAEQGPVYDLFAGATSEVACSLLGEVSSRELPDEVCRRLRGHWAPGQDAVLRITFRGPAANDPVLFQLIRDFAAPINILHGNVDYIQGKPLGTLTVAVGATDVMGIIARLNARELKGELLGYVASSDRAAA